MLFVPLVLYIFLNERSVFCNGTLYLLFPSFLSCAFSFLLQDPNVKLIRDLRAQIETLKNMISPVRTTNYMLCPRKITTLQPDKFGQAM